MRIGYLCTNGHLTVGFKKEELKGSLARQIRCIHCDSVATIFEEHTLSLNVPFHFEFFRPAIASSPDEQKYLDKGFLSMKLVEDPILTREFEATKGIIKLTQFLLSKVEPEAREPDVIDTAIKFLKQHFDSLQAMKKLPKNIDQHLN